MYIIRLAEHGYIEAARGFSLSYNSTVERAKELMPKFAFGKPGENKFLESIMVWLEIQAPRFWWQEFDTYRVGVTKQSESTMHTLSKRELNQLDFEHNISYPMLIELNNTINLFKEGKRTWDDLKGSLPEGFLQKRIVCTNYKALQNMYTQRKGHKLSQWKHFCYFLETELNHPEFIRKEENV